MDYGVYSRHSACLRTISTRCQIQSAPRQYVINHKIIGAKLNIKSEISKSFYEYFTFTLQI